MGYGAALGQRTRLFDRYVDFTAGSNGTGTRSSPYNTWASLPATTNLKVAVKRGSTWRARNDPKANGWTIDSYDTGALPVAYASDALTGWTLHSGNIYWCGSVTWTPRHVIELATPGVFSLTNIKWMARVASLAAVNSAGKWFLDTATSRVYLWASDSANPSTHQYEAQRRNQSMVMDNRTGVKVRNLNVVGAWFGIHMQNGGGSHTIGGCEFWGNWTGVMGDGSTPISWLSVRHNYCGLNGHDGAVKFYARVSDSVIEGNTFRYNACDPNAHSSSGLPDPRTSLTSAANDSRASIWVGASSTALNQQAPSRTEVPNRIKVRYNDVGYTAKAPHAPPSACPGTGIWLDGPGTDIEVAWNRSHNGKSRGINVESGYFGVIRVHHNLVWNQTDAAAGGTGILVSRSAQDVWIVHNTIWNCYQAFWAQSQVNYTVSVGDPGGFANSLWRNNLVIGGSSYVLKFLHGAANAPTGGNPPTPEGTGNRISYNLFPVDRTNWGQTQVGATSTSFGSADSPHHTLAAFEARYNQQEAGGMSANLQGDPLIISYDESSPDFLRPGETSPARNAGLVIPGINDNYLGAGPDIGALEYQVAPAPPSGGSGFGYGPFGSGSFGGSSGFGTGAFGSGPFGGTA